MDRKASANDNERMKHYRGTDNTGLSPCGPACMDDGFGPEPFGHDVFGEPGEGYLGHAPCCAETSPYPPHACRMTLSTGPFLMPRSGRLVMRVENPYAEGVYAEVSVYDLRCGHRDLLRAGRQVFKKTIKLTAHQTGTVSFDAGIPAGFLLEACVRADGLVLPMLQLNGMNGYPQELYKTTEFLSLEPHYRD